jgi:hypothetical protein
MLTSPRLHACLSSPCAYLLHCHPASPCLATTICLVCSRCACLPACLTVPRLAVPTFMAWPNIACLFACLDLAAPRVPSCLSPDLALPSPACVLGLTSPHLAYLSFLLFSFRLSTLCQFSWVRLTCLSGLAMSAWSPRLPSCFNLTSLSCLTSPCLRACVSFCLRGLASYACLPACLHVCLLHLGSPATMPGPALPLCASLASLPTYQSKQLRVTCFSPCLS